MESVTVRVPATSANVGPGFDTMGIALSLYNYLTFTRAEKTEVLGCPAAYANEDNLALVAFRAACRAAGVEPCPVRLEISADIPDSRGLGSSAAMLVGGGRSPFPAVCIPPCAFAPLFRILPPKRVRHARLFPKRLLMQMPFSIYPTWPCFFTPWQTEIQKHSASPCVTACTRTTAVR